MSPLGIFLAFVVALTALVIIYLTKQFQKENLFYSTNKQINDTNYNSNKIEKEKVVAETLNGRFAMIGLIAALGAYLTTGQIIPGFI